MGQKGSFQVKKVILGPKGSYQVEKAIFVLFFDKKKNFGKKKKFDKKKFWQKKLLAEKKCSGEKNRGKKICQEKNFGGRVTSLTDTRNTALYK